MKTIVARNWFVIGAAIAAFSLLGIARAQQRPQGNGGGGASGGANHLPDGQRGLFGPLYQSGLPVRPFLRHHRPPGVDSIRDRNEIAIDASGLDHTPVAAVENRFMANNEAENTKA